MQTIRRVAFSLSVVLPTATVLCQSYTVVPAAYAATDAASYEWVAGASQPLRQQTLIGASHLTAVVGHEITAIELRRTNANEIYQGGTTNLTVFLSTPSCTPLTASPLYAANVGANAVQVFSGQVTFPTSPATTSPNIAWTADNVVRIPLQIPYPYLGGTLCVDITGQPIPGQTANWWMADAAFEDITGSVVEIGPGCGAYGGPQHQWSHVSPRSLVPGAYARFWAYGPANSFGLAAFGSANPVGVPLTALGFPSPGCDLYLGSLDAVMAAVFEPEIHPLLTNMAIAEVRIRIPNNPAVFGLSLTTQWLEWSQLATSNAIQWTVASSIPSLDMALNEGHPDEPGGELTVDLAQVMRFEHQ